MLGSVQDAEDALQDTLLAAWQGLGGFEERASIRTWLYRVATNRCLNTLRAASRRPRMDRPIPDVELPEPTGLGEVVGLQPPGRLPPPRPGSRRGARRALSPASAAPLPRPPPPGPPAPTAGAPRGRGPRRGAGTPAPPAKPAPPPPTRPPTAPGRPPPPARHND